MSLLPIVLCGVLAASPDNRGADMELDREIQRAIETYQPAWMPPKGEITGAVVVFDPTCEAAREHRIANQLALLTVEHVYHLIQHAGGIPALTRAEDLPASSVSELGSRCQSARCHLAVRVTVATREGGEPKEPRVRAMNAQPLSLRFAGAASAPGVKEQTTIPQTIPVVEVVFAAPASFADEAARRTFHRTCGEQLCRLIIAFVRSNRDELDRLRERNWPGAAQATSQPVPYYGESARKARVEAVARRIWPDGDLPLDRAKWFCNMYRSVALSDQTGVLFEPQVTVEGGTVIVGGMTNVPSLCNWFADVLRCVGVPDIRCEMRVLPESSSLGDRSFGACIAPMSRTFDRPDDGAVTQTELLYGEPVLVLDGQEHYLLVQASDGYWGWVRRDAIRLMTREQFNAYTAPRQAVLLHDVELAETWIRAGTRLPVASVTGRKVVLQRPDGETFEPAPGDVRVIDDAESVATRVRGALAMLHTPYLFGARSSLGSDCSGMIGTLTEMVGDATARDAAQQYVVGKLVATRWYRDRIQTGDRIYFIEPAGKVFHTGLAISPTHFIHCSPPGVQISSLKKGDRLYDAFWDETFLGAKRQ